MKLLAEAATCFANARGGAIVVGVDDKATGPEAFSGCDLEPQEVQREIYERTEPSLMVATEQVPFCGTQLLVIEVPKSLEIHADPQGRATRRVGKKCLPLSPTEQALLREEKRGVDWSAARPSAAPTLSPRAIEAARRVLARADDERRPLSTLSEPELLRALGLVDSDGGLVNAGALLLGGATDEGEPSLVYQYRPSPGGEAAAVERLQGSLILVLDRALELVRSRRNVSPITLATGEQIEFADFPELAVREILANALLHREYRLEGPVHVEHSPASLVVTSPGPLVGGVTASNILTHPSKPRNASLFKAARTLRIAEETGRGIDRAYREMLRSGRDIPTIEDRGDSVRVALTGGAPRTQVARFVAELPETERDDVDTLLVLFVLCSRQTITADELAPLIQKTPEEAEATLDRLSREPAALLETTRASRRMRRSEYRLRGSTLQRLGSAVRYHRRSIDEIDRKVIAHLREYDRVTNKTLRNMLDIDVYRARDLLRDLVAREIIVKTSKQERGRSVEYGAGSRFPRAPSARQRRTRRKDAAADEPTLFDQDASTDERE